MEKETIKALAETTARATAAALVGNAAGRSAQEMIKDISNFSLSDIHRLLVNPHRGEKYAHLSEPEMVELRAAAIKEWKKRGKP